MIKGIGAAYIHTPNNALADWYADKLGLKKGYGDAGWTSAFRARRCRSSRS